MCRESRDDSVVVYDGAVARADLDAWESELESVFTWMRPLFYRTESRKHAEQYLRGLLSPIARKNGWTIAEYVGEREPKALRLLAVSSGFGDQVGVDAAWRVDEGVRVPLGA